MNGLEEHSLLDLVEFIVDNRGRTCPTSNDGFPLIATNCIKEGRRDVVFENIRFVDEDTYRSWFRSHPMPGDVLFVCKGSPGRVAVVPDPVPYCIAQDMVALRASREIHPGYLYYRLCAPDVRTAIENMHVGTMIPHFKKGDFGHLRFEVHRAVSEQRAIAEILGTLDDKIATNRKIVSTCSDLLDAHYTSACPVESNETLGDVAVIGGGGTPSTKNDAYWSGDVHWATPTDITALDGPWLLDTARKITNAGLEACASPFYPKRSILMTSRATIGSIALAGVPTAVNQGFIVVNAKDPHLQLWLMTQMKSRTAEFLSWSNGATFLEISRGIFKALPYYSSTPANLERFNDRAEVLVRRQEAAQRETQVLTRTRTELIPLLMNGTITVKQAEAKAEEVL